MVVHAWVDWTVFVMESRLVFLRGGGGGGRGENTSMGE